MQHMGIFAPIAKNINHCGRCALRHMYLHNLTHIAPHSSVYPSVHVTDTKKIWICKSVNANMESMFVNATSITLHFYNVEFYCCLLCTTPTCTLNLNQSNLLYLSFSQSFSIGLTAVGGALQPRELLLRRQSRLPRRRGRNRRCLEEDPSLCPQHLPAAS